MAEKGTNLTLDEVERNNLSETISRLEAAMAASTPDIRSALNKILQGAKERAAILDKRIEKAEVEREVRAREQSAAIADLAQREAALSEHEREVYNGFLRKEFFAKADFKELEKFYSSTWDRLSERGKDEMSQRVWEGVRRGEYQFSELPEPVQDKEAEHAYKRMRDSAIGAASIPATDREDFIRTWESGRRQDAERILDRPSFKEHMFRGGESKARSRSTAIEGRESDGVSAGEAILNQRISPEGTRPGTASRFGNINLEGIELTESSSPPSVSDMPSGSPQKAGRGITS